VGRLVRARRGSPAPANLQLTLLSSEGKPIPLEGIALRKGSYVIPSEVVAAHLSAFALPATTDGAGRLILAALESGDYEIYLARSSNPLTIASGQPHGHLGSVSLAPLATAELEITIDAR
jgi:hypothetical protein